MMHSFPGRAADSARLAEITRILARHGLGWLAARFLPSGESADAGDGDPATTPRRVRLALEELGPAWIKLGQILATRADLLPPEWIAELERLQSQAPTLPFAALRPDLEQALGAPVDACFASFDEAPLAAASMAQVHRATLHDGRAVVVKIRRPGIAAPMLADLRLIAGAAALAERTNAQARRLRAGAMAAELADALRQELDFTVEGRNADKLRADFARNPHVIVPEIHWPLSSESVLLMDYVAGVAPTSAQALLEAGIDPASIAALGADVVLDMVLINGRFHGDPHPGNLRCTPGNGIALLDLGLVGQVSPRRREEFIRFTQALITTDDTAMADVLATWDESGSAPPAAVAAAARRLVETHGGQSLRLAPMVADFLPLLRETGIVMPSDLLLIFKALVTIDGVLTRIEPGFDLAAALRRSTLRLVAARLSPDHWQPIVRALGLELAHMGNDAPRLLRAAVQRLTQPPAPIEPSPQWAALVRPITRAIWGAGTLVAMALVAARLLG
ncbi:MULTISPECIES: AarF/UbiB family protein [unclassified Novosphingobium]|uniref:ABC1 kinase family protein n=1 Tax=unclassified Novosphingobium TaxID=2644732 RepID=UPI00146E84A5|nr:MULTISPECIES: AarF/UbiB family protein [unclassified Novosphingobium]NMN06644.1 ubiquinone biosynthesis protein [Novosphingobium sp. SG919]NMN88905.1 ubiquinone biosynthesis protein [Novosphingobium sp. SG916]